MPARGLRTKDSQHGGRARTTERHGGKTIGASREAHIHFLRGSQWSSIVLRVESFPGIYRTQPSAITLLASSFQGIALAVENFSGYAVYSNSFSATEIDRKATAFHAEYSDLMGRTRREYKRYGDRHAARIDQELRQRMQAAGFLRETDAA